MNDSVKPSVILFDVNETLLNMTLLKRKVNNLLESRRGFRIWFRMLLHFSLVDNCTGLYHDFSSIADATLDMAAKALDEDIDANEKKEALAAMKKLTAHSDIKEGLTLLKEAGYRLATLTNSNMETLTAQMECAGLTSYFEATLSVDAVKKYKPSPEPYQYAAQTLGVPLNHMVMVASHGWDIAGALEVGMQTAFIARKGQSLYPLAPPPQFIGKDLVDVAKKIIENYK